MAEVVFVTGGSGFVGAAIVRDLVAAGHRVRALARSDASARAVASIGAEPVRGELDDDASLAPAMAGATLVVHAAASLTSGVRYRDHRRTNVDGTRAVLDAARRAKVRRFIYISAASIVMKLDEPTQGDESLPVQHHPSMPYSATKGLAERLVLDANDAAMTTIALRPPFVWGPGAHSVGNIARAFRERRFVWVGDGAFPYSVCHVDNLAVAVVRAVERGQARSRRTTRASGTPSRVTMVDDTDRGSEREGAPRLAQLRGKGSYSVVSLPNQWFVLATSREVGDEPVARTLMGTPLVLFRDGLGKVGALLDRCPHRNVPLSGGEVAKDGNLQCPYHGWRFDRGGACRAIPSFTGTVENKARNCLAYPVIEQQGFVWVYSTPFAGSSTALPEKKPHFFAYADDPAYVTVRQALDQNGTLFSALENALDVPHTAFLHRGLFRSESRGITLKVKVSRTQDRCTAEYCGEPRPPGFMARVLSPSGGEVQHWDRFILPSIAQVEYKIGEENHVLADTAMTPISDFETRLWGVVSLKTRLPGRLVEPFVKPIGLRVLMQDAAILKQQTETVKRFGGEQFTWTEIDVLGKHIWRLLKAAERGEPIRETEASELSLVV